MFRNKGIVIVAVLLILSVVLGGCGQTKDVKPDVSQQEKKKVTLVLDWTPNTNHTGLYVAKEKGFYSKQGLEVEIIQPGQGTTADQLVAAGKADFGISYQEGVTQARATDIPLVSIAAVIQHNTSAFASLKKSNIQSVKDFEGKRYGGWGSPVEEAMIKAVMAKGNADAAKVKVSTLGATDFFTSIGRDADFEWIYYGWDGVEAKRRGIELNLLMLKDLDPALDYYTPVLVTSEKLAAEQKDLAKKFVAATAEGYEFAVANPNESAEILLKNAPELNKDLVMQSQAWLSKEYQADAKQWGMQKGEVWQKYTQWMFERQLVPKMIDTTKAFTNEFLPKK